MIALLLFVVGFPEEIVYGLVAPAFGLGIFLASACYFVFGYFLAKATGRTDVTALPSGPSAPSIFTVTFLVIVPVYLSTKNAEFAFQIALVWCFFEAMILVVGSFLGDTIRRMIPRTVLLSCLSGLGLLLLAMNPMLQSFETPVVAFAVLIIIFLNWFGKSRCSRKFLQASFCLRQALCSPGHSACKIRQRLLLPCSRLASIRQRCTLTA